jgi:predicted dehydrogenase
MSTAAIAGTAMGAGGKAAAAGWRPKISNSIRGANSDIRVAVIGMNGKGKTHIAGFKELPGVRVVALCDVDREVLDKNAAKLDGSVATYTDARYVIDDPNIDVITIATPNHWHSLLAIWGCQAGKDVYVEKPICNTIWEGGQLIKAKDKYNRIVQSGTQNRSDVGLIPMYKWLHEGNIGKVTMVRGLCYKNRDSIGKLDAPLVPPASVDYNLWLGPAQDEPIYRPKLHYDWHWSWNTGNGDIGNQGPHETDLIRWAMQDKGMPSNVMSFGGRFGWNDAGQTPNMQLTAYEFNGIPVFFEVRDLKLTPDLNAAPSFMGTRIGVVITCEGGYFVGGRGGGWIYDNDGKKMQQFKGDGGGEHMGNFIDAVRSRKEADLRAPLSVGHSGANMTHIANISYRVGQDTSPGELRERLNGDKLSLEAIDRYSEHLAAWNVDFKKTPWTAGPNLQFDNEAKRFTGPMADKANVFLHRQDRAPFIVPKKV